MKPQLKVNRKKQRLAGAKKRPQHSKNGMNHCTLIDDAGIRQTLRKIITRLTPNPALQDDLMQECLIRLWRLESEEPGHTRSWYLQNCRFHLQHFLASGRSLDSLKRAHHVTIDGVGDGFPLDREMTTVEPREVAIVRDIVATLAGHLKPCESAVLGGLADGMVLQEIAAKLNLSYPTALKYRRKIAALSIKLGIPPPPPYKRERARHVRPAVRVGHRQKAAQTNGAAHHNPPSNVLRANRRKATASIGRAFSTHFNPLLRPTIVESVSVPPDLDEPAPSLVDASA
jgi:DNA-directed RNA polymerase specialized sigma24 family protein